MSGRRSNRTTEHRRVDDVEELLKATEDELLLDISVGSHMSKVAPSYIDSDLNRRFQALKKPSSASSSIPNPPTQKLPSEKSVDDGGDLLARFAALKGSGHSSAIGSHESWQSNCNELGRDSNEEEDEVEKIIQWAKDAARLDPSLPTDSDDSDNFQPSDVDDNDDDDDDDDSEEDEEKRFHKKKLSSRRGLPK